MTTDGQQSGLAAWRSVTGRAGPHLEADETHDGPRGQHSSDEHTAAVVVDDLVGRALGSGGRPWLPTREDGSTYTGSFADPDGNVWQVTW